MPAAPHRTLVAALRAMARPDAVAEVARFFHADPDARSSDNRILGVPIGQVFPIAKAHAGLPLDQVEALLDDPHYEVRMAAVSVMDFQARARRTPPAQRQALFELYLRRHDRINNWDLVDRAAPHVVGGWLADRPRDALYQLARSPNPWERRTAIVATWFFIRTGDIDDTFRLAELLLHDAHPLVQKAVGSWVREAGKHDPSRLLAFLEAFATTMPRPMLRQAVEKLPVALKTRFLE